MRKLIIVIGLWLLAIGAWVWVLAPSKVAEETTTQVIKIAEPNPNPYHKLYDELLRPSVKISAGISTGSGVVIASDDTKTYILTAAHVVGDESTVQIWCYDYEPDKSGNYSSCLIYEANVVITDTAKDLALLRVLGASAVKPAKLAPRDYTPYIFTPVWAVGCSLGFPPRPSSGIITAINPDNLRQSASYWEMSAPIVPGNSGGGVFTTNTHELIGIAVWVRVYRGQLITTMAGIVKLPDIYEFLNKAGLVCQSGRSESILGTPRGSRRGFNPVHRLMVLMAPSGQGTLTGGHYQKKGGENTMPIVSHVQLVVLRPALAPQRVVDQWADGLKTNAERVNQKRKAVITNEDDFQSKLASPSNQEFGPVINPAFISRAGLTHSEIIDAQKENLKQAYDKYNDSLDRAFETVDGIPAKRFKEKVDFTTGRFSKGVAKRTLPFTGTKIEGRGPAAIAGLWLTDDPMAERLIRGGDNILEGGPYLICIEQMRAALKAALTQRITQGGNAIIRSDYLLATFTAQNDLTNRLVQGFINPLLGLTPFTTGGTSRVDFIRIHNDLFLEIQVSTV